MISVTSKKGDVAEIAVMLALKRLGFFISRPWGLCHYDFIVDIHGKLLRVQVKTGRYANGVVNASIRKPNGTTYTNIDVFGIYCPKLDKSYLVPRGSTNTTLTLRIDEPKNNQSKKLIWAKEYEIPSDGITSEWHKLYDAVPRK